jgi:hypothetical protein
MDLHYKNLSLDDIVYLDDNGVQCVEIWKDIPDYEGLYQVSDLGRVKSYGGKVCTRLGKLQRINPERILKQGLDGRKYFITIICKFFKRKTFRVHKLVAMAFLNHKPDGTQRIVVDHISNNGLDNRAKNLQLISNRKNSSKNRLNRTSGITGVALRKNGKYVASICYKGNSTHLGTFKTKYEAYKCYQNTVKHIENGGEIKVKTKTQTKTSKHKGVYFDKSRGKYGSTYNEKNLGRFNTELEAYQARDEYIKNLNK